MRAVQDAGVPLLLPSLAAPAGAGTAAASWFDIDQSWRAFMFASVLAVLLVVGLVLLIVNLTQGKPEADEPAATPAPRRRRRST